MNMQVNSPDDDCHILFVEDDEDTRDMVSFVLQREGYKVTTTPTIAKALQLAKQENFSLYLLDSRLPDGTGVELCELIRCFDNQTPIVFYSGEAYEADIREALASGAQEYLVKPCSTEKLEATIDKFLNDEC
jgi:DNA-binding response OmpR family regulator